MLPTFLKGKGRGLKSAHAKGTGFLQQNCRQFLRKGGGGEEEDDNYDKEDKEKRALIKILFCKHIKSCQLLNILNAHKNVHRWASFLLTLV